MALKRRSPAIGLLNHSDQGSTYAREDCQDVLDACGIVCRMSRRGNCWDNAVMESFFSTVKSELGDQFTITQACSPDGWTSAPPSTPPSTSFTPSSTRLKHTAHSHPVLSAGT